MNVHTHELCTEDHPGTHLAGLIDPAWLDKPHCVECGEVMPAALVAALSIHEAFVENLAARTLESLEISLALANQVEGMSASELEAMYGPAIASLMLRARDLT